MVTVIHNVTRDMDQISCYADNGYGTPMQASRKINISREFRNFRKINVGKTVFADLIKKVEIKTIFFLPFDKKRLEYHFQE